MFRASGVQAGKVKVGPAAAGPEHPSTRTPEHLNPDSGRLLSSRRAGLRLGRLTDLRSLIFAAFLIATRLKLGDRLAWCPVDPTTLLGLAVGTMALWRLIKKDFRLPANTLWVWPLWLLFTVPLLSTDLSVAYAADKVTRLFTLTLVAVLAPFLLCRTRRELFRFLNALALLGLIGGIQGVLTLLAGGGGHRLTAFGAQTIALARGTGMAAIWLSILMLERYALPPLLSICLVGPLAVTLLGAGSRGPILGTIGALMLLGFLFYRRDRAQLRRFVGLLLALTLAAAYGLSHAPDESAARLQQFAGGRIDHSGQLRVNWWGEALDTVRTTPLGIGWGSFARQVLHWKGNTRDGETDYWPHNLLLEITLEAGWLTGLYVVVLLLVGLCRAYSRASSPETRAVFALLFFYIVNAMVSYDVNDNKLLFTFIALALAGLSGRGQGRVPACGCANSPKSKASRSLTLPAWPLAPDP